MARFISTITSRGSEVLTQFLAAGRELIIFKAVAGDGISSAPIHTMTDMVSPVEVEALVGGKEWVQGSPGQMQVTVELTNRGLTHNTPIRELGTFAYDMDGAPFLFTYSRLEGGDSDNILSPPEDPSQPDTSHIHNLAVVITEQEYGAITVEVSAGFGVTMAQMVAYAAPKYHTQTASTIQEATGESTEEAQRRQDYAIKALQEQLDTGFTGLSLTWGFTAVEMDQWQGYEGGLVEGIWDTGNNRMVVKGSVS